MTRGAGRGGGRAEAIECPGTEEGCLHSLALSFHAGYRCEQTGLCCRAGWPIPVEAEIERALRGRLVTGRLRSPHAPEAHFRPLPGLPEGARSILGQDGCGRCLFLEEGEGRRPCSVHRQLGPTSLPAACRHFPRLAALTPRGVLVSLSHFCSTAARALLPDAPVTVIEDPPAFPPGAEYEGLDARRAWPPLLRPGVLLGWDGHELWERHAVTLLASGRRLPEEAVAYLLGQAEEARAWTAGGPPLAEYLASVLAREPRVAWRPWSFDAPGAPGTSALAACLGLRESVRGAVPPHLAPAPAQAGLGEADARWVEPAWPDVAGPVGRYLAARAFASWCAIQGSGLRTTARALAAALAVLRVAAAAVAAGIERPLRVDDLVEVFREADLLQVHLASPEALAERLSAVEGPRGRRRGSSTARPAQR